MGQIANQMALELFFKIKERIKEKKKQKKKFQVSATINTLQKPTALTFAPYSLNFAFFYKKPRSISQANL